METMGPQQDGRDQLRTSTRRRRLRFMGTTMSALVPRLTLFLPDRTGSHGAVAVGGDGSGDAGVDQRSLLGVERVGGPPLGESVGVHLAGPAADGAVQMVVAAEQGQICGSRVAAPSEG